MKERIEDLGRLYEKIKTLHEHHLFDLWNCRAKDFVDWFYEQTKDKQEDILHTVAYSVQHISEKLCDCIIIAKGDSDDNPSI